MGKLLISHRSTACPCSVPGLGRLTGAGRIRLTRDKSNFFILIASTNTFFCRNGLSEPHFFCFNFNYVCPSNIKYGCRHFDETCFALCNVLCCDSFCRVCSIKFYVSKSAGQLRIINFVGYYFIHLSGAKIVSR